MLQVELSQTDTAKKYSRENKTLESWAECDSTNFIMAWTLDPRDDSGLYTEKKYQNFAIYYLIIFVRIVFRSKYISWLLKML